jgi:phosphinothricin acetyltransferase
MGSIHIRRATTADAGPINDILNYYVERSTATFATTPLTLADRLAWLASRSDAHPALVAVRDDEVVGWSALSVFRSREAYAQTVELGVYVHHARHRQGIGRLLVAELLALARTAGHHAVVGGCCSESTASIALLESFGFVRVAHFREVGRKFDRWLDVVFLELLL